MRRRLRPRPGLVGGPGTAVGGGVCMGVRMGIGPGRVC